jgi:predicted alpha/beta hydrolase family esterase
LTLKEKEGNKVIVPTFPTPENQTLENRMKVFKPYLKEINENTIFVGHSLGPAFIF